MKTQFFKPTHPKPTPSVAIRQPVDKTDVVCYNYAQPGHASTHCPVKKPKSARLCYLPTSTMQSRVNKEPTISVLLNGKLAYC